MKRDILIAGVGGQGILSLAYVLDNAALEAGLNFKQTEVHGMAQRGGGVISHVRIADQTIYSDMVPKGQADIILGVEPLEILRYMEYLKPKGLIITNTEPFVNILNYPDIEEVKAAIKSYNHIFVEAAKLAKEAGSLHSQNMVLLGALSKFLPIDEAIITKWIENLFKAKGEKLVNLNFKAFKLGQETINTD